MIPGPGDHIVFLGDSVTDCDRDRSASGDEALGLGFVRFVHSYLQAWHPELGLRITNRGVSGDRVYDLEERLDRDVLAEEPDVVSILIGINDTWQRYGDHKRISPISEFSACYRRILRRLSGNAKVVLCEPFLLPVPEDRKTWREDLDPRIGAVRDLAVEWGVPLVQLDERFAEVAKLRPPEFWLPDGVHPSQAGHGVIANSWLDTVFDAD
jgi:acyl-CoA thioesterase-1